MPVAVPSTAGEAGGPPEAGLAARVAAGPGLWEDGDWLADLRRESIPESLLADGTIAAASAAEHRHKLERALNAEVTALCLVTGALFPVLGYDAVLALVFGMPGVPARPGTPVPTGPAYSKARERHGEAPARAMFESDAARTDIPAGQDGTAFGLELTQIDGTTLELFNDPALAGEFGIPAPGAKPLLRLVGLLHSGTRRWKAAVIGRYLDGENALADGLQDAFGPGQLNLADRGFLSMDRWIRFSAAGAHLLWRVKNGAKSVPFKTLEVLKDRSELVLLRESAGMRGRRRKAVGDPALPSLPDTVARLVCFTVLTRTRSGRTKTTQIRLLTTLLDPGLCPAGELAVLYQKRWLIEIAFLHLKRTVRGARRVLRGRSETLVRQETWALLLVHNMIAGLAARAAATAGLSPGQVCFTAVLSLARAAVTASTCCPHCGKRAASANAPTAALDAAILALPPGRADRQRTSGRTAAQRRKWISEPADYTLTIIPSNLSKTDISLGS
ncbi:MAG: IS4 family transposase [Actinomycetota bacterium]|nr:IS4 family transposase [Actinomycetota bacterium]